MNKFVIGLLVVALGLIPIGVYEFEKPASVKPAEVVTTVPVSKPKPKAIVKPQKKIKQTNCAEVKKYVDRYGWSAVEQELRNRGVSDKRIAYTKTCIK